MKRLCVAVVLIVVAACASTPEKPPWWQGAQLDEVIKRMGRYPESNRDYEDVTIYTWSVNQPGTRLFGTTSAEICSMDVATKAKRVTLMSFNGPKGACEILHFWDEAT